MSRGARIGGDAMGSGGNFARELTIDAAGNLLAAKGPLNATDDNINFKLYAYVYQTRDDGSGAAFSSELDEEDIETLPRTLLDLEEPAGQWIMPRGKLGASAQDGKSEQEGTFHPGPATGVALAIARTPDEQNPKTTVTWWTDTPTLVREGAPGA